MATRTVKKKAATSKKASKKRATPPPASRSAKKPAAPKKASSSSKSSRGPAKRNAPPASNSSMLEDFFKDELKDIYWAEKHLTKALPKMQKAATSEDLKNALAEHLEVTKEHIARLEEVFGLMGQKPQAKKCDAMAGLTEEGNGIIEETEKGTSTRDVGIILACQKVEHYEIATYGGLATLAKVIGRDDVAEILATTLGEEKEADELLTQLAEGHINSEAASEDDDEEDEKDMDNE